MKTLKTEAIAAIRVEENPPLREAFEEMTRKMIDAVMKYNDTSNITTPELLREIRKNVRALGGFL